MRNPIVIMHDIETLGTDTVPVILSIGAVAFDPFEEKKILSEFKVNVDFATCMDLGASITPSTLKFWMDNLIKNPPLVEMFEGKETIHSAIGAYGDWLYAQGLPSEMLVMGNGTDFDTSILGHYFNTVQGGTPWHFRNTRCFRTISALGPDVPWPVNAAKHDSLADAKVQAERVISIMNHLGLTTL